MKFNFSRVLEVSLVIAALGSFGLVLKQQLSPPPIATRPTHSITLSDWREQLASERRIGPPTAPYKLAVWTDYQCPACKQLEVEIGRLRSRLGDSLTVAYRYFPLPSHSLAFSAATLAECAGRADKFAEIHEALFAMNIAGPSLQVDSIVKQSGIKINLKPCLEDSSAKAVVQNDVKRGNAYGFQGTPYLQIGKTLSMGGMRMEALDSLVHASARD